MKSTRASVSLTVDIERWPLKAPFRITGYTHMEVAMVVVTLEKSGLSGRGEAAGVYYFNENVDSMVAQIEGVRGQLESGIDRAELQRLMPRGGARNAVDCAMWDLDSKLQGRPAWQLAGLSEPTPQLTTFTSSAGDPEAMAKVARGYADARAIKIKLTGEPVDAERVRAVREACPDVWLAVDANQGFTRESLETLMPVLLETRVMLLEQPFRIGQEALLDGFESPIPIAADESAQEASDVAALAERFDVINIKLDKCGGLTAALEMAREAQRCGLDPMVGNMLGTSLAMAPAFLVAQLCKVVDLDGPVFLAADREPTVDYTDGRVSCPPELWGNGGTVPRTQTA